METKMMNELFTGHLLNEKGFARVQDIGRAFDTLLKVVEAAVPEGRQLSIVRTKLEEACFYAKKGVANQQEYQEDAE
jgi:hypothetical protein